MKIRLSKKGEFDVVNYVMWIAVAIAFGVLGYSYAVSVGTSDYYEARRDAAIFGLAGEAIPKLQGEFMGVYDINENLEYKINTKEVFVKGDGFEIRHSYSYDENKGISATNENGKLVIEN